MKAATAIAIIVVVAVLVLWGVATFVRGALEARSRRRDALEERNAPWEAGERSDGEGLHLTCVRPGEEPLPVRYVPFGPNFDYEIEEARADQRRSLVALNSNRAPRRRRRR